MSETQTFAPQGKTPSPDQPFSSGGGFAALRLAAAQDQTRQRQSRIDEEAAADPFSGMSAQERRDAKRMIRRLKGSFRDYPHLLAIKPREGYVFRSDYFHIDDTVGCVLGFFHDDVAQDDFGAFWGINRIPAGLGDGVSVVMLEQVRRMGKKWIEDRLTDSERLENMDRGEQAAATTNSSRRKAQKVSSDVDEVTGELNNGASYLHVHNRLLVRAASLDALDVAIEKIRRLYIDRFGTLTVAAYPGEQRQELSTLFSKNDRTRGKGQHFTSVEFAGAHSLVTNGLNDPAGEYVGSMLGDVNNSAVLFDVNDYQHHVVVADATINPVLGRCHVPDMWGSKASQSALLNNGRVVHLVLDGADLNTLGPALTGVTARLDMSTGDINMFEMFGDAADEFAIFSAHLEKLVLMAEQAYATTDSDRSIIRGSLKETLTMFYIDKGMWVRNAKENRERVRIVGLEHTHLPRLQDLVSYFDTAYVALKNSTARDDKQMNAYNVLRLTFKDMLDNEGDLFNTFTSTSVDGVSEARRVLYDFSKLLNRSQGVAMAQLVNTVGFAVNSLGLGDTVIIHGAEYIEAGVKPYITTQLERLFKRGGRVMYLYNDVDKMLGDAEFNKFDRADWTVLGPMGENTVAAYQQKLKQDIPPDLERLITQRTQGLAYLRRDVTNVVFHLDLALGVNPARAAQREEAARQVTPLSRAALTPATSSSRATQGAAAPLQRTLLGATQGRPASPLMRNRMLPTR